MTTAGPAGGAPGWLSPAAPAPAPGRLAEADDRTTAAAAVALARRGTTLAYRGDYRNARQLLAAMARRLEAGPAARGGRHTGGARGAPTVGPGQAGATSAGAGALLEAFRAERRQRREAHLVLSRLAVPVAAGFRVDLQRAPDATEALREALGPDAPLPGLLPLRDLLGMIGAHEWRVKGVEVPALGAHLHPRYGVFAPVRGEHVDLVAEAARRWPPAGKQALDVGTGSGVLALVLARAGARVTATDLSPAAVASAREDAARLGLSALVEPLGADLFPDGRFDLVVCNPPWLPAEAVTALEQAVYDPGGAFLARLLAGLAGHLAVGGEAWLVLSDLAERLGLRAPGEVDALVAGAGLVVREVLEVRPHHPRTRDAADPLHAARAAEITSLRRLGRAAG